MYISKFQIKNYKSFYVTDEINLSPRFNVIVGQNNSGKTALVEALSLRFSHKPHRSLATVPTPRTQPYGISEVHVAFALTRQELLKLLAEELGQFAVPLPLPRVQPFTRSIEDELQNFRDAIEEVNEIHCIFRGEELIKAWFPAHGDPDRSREMINVRVDPDNLAISLSEVSIATVREDVAIERSFARQIAQIFKARVYAFKAERLDIGASQVHPQSYLQPNASNLAQVLHHLQSRNLPRFQRFNEFVATILPDIKQIMVPVTGDNQVQVFVWDVDPETERDDLAIPLAESGTGIGQVLAILYVVVTSDYPSVIVIDEPQSFLHPNAVRKLFDILQQHPQHQYVVTTHSPHVITSTDPQTLLLVRKEEAQSKTDVVNVAETLEMRRVLTEVGARLSDVFGADSILWVEGPTEEHAFPLIVREILKKPLLGIEVIGVSHTGDFEAKRSRTAFDIYRRLSEGRALLPPAIGFVFDREGRNEIQRNDLIRQSGGAVYFTSRRMYENYLLNPRAIAFVASNIQGFRDTPLTEGEVTEWIEAHRWATRYFEGKVPEQQTQETWLQEVHGARVLKDLFEDLSEQRVTYDKVHYGLALTQWLIVNEPDELKEIATLLEGIISDRM